MTDFLEEVPYFATPPQLEGMRKVLGMSHLECGLLLGGVAEGEVRTLEKPQTRFVFDGHEAALLDMLNKVEEHIDLALETPPAIPFLITYRGDDQFKEFDPALARWMRFATVHRAFVWRVWWELAAKGVNTTIVVLQPKDYIEFLTSGNRDDTRPARAEWAMEYVKRYVYFDGPPTRTISDAEQIMARRSSLHKDGIERPRRRARVRLRGAKTVV